MDAISMLKDDHKTVERLFKRFEKAGPRAHVEKREIVDRIIEELSVHAAIEEQCFYPVVRATVAGTEDLALESLEEHHVVKWMLSELETMSPEAERFDAKVTVLIENVRHHVKEEENDFFPKVRKELGRASLNDLGEVMAAAKNAAPTHPHPRSPDTPPGNLIAGTAAGVADRIADTVNGFAQGGVSAVGDIIATVLGRKRAGRSATGSKLARKTASQVRERTAEATEAVIDGARKASGGANGSRQSANGSRSRARTATSSAKRAGTRTASSARKTAKRAASTAKRGTTTARRTAKKAGARK